MSEAPQQQVSDAPRRTARRGDAAFSSFFERNALRENRLKSRRRTIVVSVAVHVVALGSLVFLSLWQVDELFGPSVEVKMFSPDEAPAGVAP